MIPVVIPQFPPKIETEENETVRVTLVFKNDEQKEFFMGQLSDGWGENECSLKWQGDFHDAAEYEVDPTISEYWDGES